MAATNQKRAFFTRAAALIFALMVLCALILPQPAEAAAAYPSVRVKLNLSGSSLKVKVTGSYVLKEAPSETLKSGSTYTVKVSGSNVRVTGTGVDTTLSSATFVRQSSAASPDHLLGIGSYNYLGNICFTAVNGAVQAINTLDLEHYLYGVVSREMGEYFPAEALKAQAVCARGYAIRKIDRASSSSAYDIFGASSDQAYIGYNASYDNSINAVNSTKGQVLMYNGKIVETFFSASNGGQTECTGSTWGGGADKDATYPYYIEKDDPYDIASCAGNKSYENVIFVPADPTGSVSSSNTYSNDVLNDLQQRAYDALKEEYDLSDAAQITLTKINSFANGQKRWENYPNSRSYVTAVANVTVALPEEQTATLDLTITLMNKNGSSYSLTHDYLNGNFRLRYIEETEGGWNLINRRYGHGIGMSQMGAKNMAKEHGMVHSEILEFYYPGTTLTTIATGNWGADSSVTIGASFVTGITPGTDASVLLKALGGGYSLCSSDGSSKTSGKLLTGDIVKDAAGKTYPVVIYGDLNSDGEIALTDLLRQQKHLLGMITLEGACLEAADVTKDGKVDIADLLRIQKHLLGAATIGQ